MKCGSIILGLGTVSASERADVLEKVRVLIHEVTDPLKCAYIIEGLKTVLAYEITDVVEKGRALIHAVTDPMKCFYIIETIGKDSQQSLKRSLDAQNENSKKARKK